MLWTLAVLLFILWLLGFGVFHVAGGLIHILLVIAVVVILLRLIGGRPPGVVCRGGPGRGVGLWGGGPAPGGGWKGGGGGWGVLGFSCPAPAANSAAINVSMQSRAF